MRAFLRFRDFVTPIPSLSTGRSENNFNHGDSDKATGRSSGWTFVDVIPLAGGQGSNICRSLNGAGGGILRKPYGGANPWSVAASDSSTGKGNGRHGSTDQAGSKNRRKQGTSVRGGNRSVRVNGDDSTAGRESHDARGSGK